MWNQEFFAPTREHAAGVAKQRECSERHTGLGFQWLPGLGEGGPIMGRSRELYGVMEPLGVLIVVAIKSIYARAKIHRNTR